MRATSNGGHDLKSCYFDQHTVIIGCTDLTTNRRLHGGSGSQYAVLPMLGDPMELDIECLFHHFG